MEVLYLFLDIFCFRKNIPSLQLNFLLDSSIENPLEYDNEEVKRILGEHLILYFLVNHKHSDHRNRNRNVCPSAYTRITVVVIFMDTY